jgi:hypothetical protein
MVAASPCPMENRHIWDLWQESRRMEVEVCEMWNIDKPKNLWKITKWLVKSTF